MQWSVVGALWICVILLINEYRKSRRINQAIKEIRVETQWQIMVLQKALEAKREDSE